MGDCPDRDTTSLAVSLAYRITVSESLRRHVVLEDGLCSGLEILDVLPAGEMDELLREELAGRGFEPESDGRMRRCEQDGTEVVVDPRERSVTIRGGAATAIEIERTGVGHTAGPDGSDDRRANLRVRVRAELEEEAAKREGALRSELTEALERRLLDLRTELDGVSHRVVGRALRTKAAQLGEVTEVSEDEESGALTIRVRL